MYPPIRLPPSSSRLIFARPSVPHGSPAALAGVPVVASLLSAASSCGAAATEPDSTPTVPATTSDWFKKSRRLTRFDGNMTILSIEWTRAGRTIDSNRSV
jgi:hypothetical protein